MSWRIVNIQSRSKLDYKMNYLVVRNDQVNKIHLSEISTIIIESTAVSMTAALLNELIKRKIKVVFCDEKRNPSSELVGYYGSHDTSMKVKDQIQLSNETKALIWTEIVREKINKQKELLIDLGINDSNVLETYASELQINDSSNREGHAARVYFNALFGTTFSRNHDSPINSALNYGYNIVLSAFNREIVANGYITQLGISHDNRFNHFNLGSDLMEPFRPLIDSCVYKMKNKEFGKEEKYQLIDVLNYEVEIEGKKQYVNNAIKIYCKSVFESLAESDYTLLSFYSNEF